MPPMNTAHKSWRTKIAPLILTASTVVEHLSKDPAFQLVGSTSGTSKVLHGLAIFPDVSIFSSCSKAMLTFSLTGHIHQDTPSGC